MKALVMRAPGEYGVEDVKKPVPGFQEVLVRMHSVAICGSDPPLLAGESLKDGLPAYMPFIPGHEGAGVVEAAGSGVTDFKPGNMVAAEAHLGCGHCANCRMGRYNLCLNFGSREQGHKQYGFTAQGCYAQYCVYHIRAVHHIPDGLTCEHGAMADTMATALHGIESVGIRPGGITAVMGCGPVGMSAMLLAKAMGSRVILCGRGSRLERGKQMGADVVLDYTAEDIGARIHSISGGIGADQVIECAGTELSFRNCIAGVKRGGKIALLSSPRKSSYEIDMKAIMWNELTLCGSRGNPNSHQQVMQMMKMGIADPLPMITHRFALEDMREAVDVFTQRRDGCIKALIQL